ncbi:MAG: DksA C4-type protein [Bacteroidetes bacterium]|nr:DksA C4-type protein [Bacteroidota bacterium]
MKKSSRHLRRVLLGKLYAHLEEHYSISPPDDFSLEHRISLHQLDAILAFKSDSYLDELRSAFERLEDGTFGFCLSCKDRIEDNLMGADPTRRLCERCELVYSHVALRYEGVPLHA